MLQALVPLKIKGRRYVSTGGSTGHGSHWEVKVLSPPWQSLKDFHDGKALELF